MAAQLVQGGCDFLSLHIKLSCALAWVRTCTHTACEGCDHARSNATVIHLARASSVECETIAWPSHEICGRKTKTTKTDEKSQQFKLRKQAWSVHTQDKA
eukprot:6091989-Pleurochrysis_carterae.AAC.2